MQEERDIFNEYQQIVYSLFETLRGFEKELKKTYDKFKQAVEENNAKTVVKLQVELTTLLRQGPSSFVNTYEGYRTAKSLSYYPKDVPLPITFSSDLNRAIFDVYEILKNEENEIVKERNISESQINAAVVGLMDKLSEPLRSLFVLIEARYVRAFGNFNPSKSKTARNQSKYWLSWNALWFSIAYVGTILISLALGSIIYQAIDTMPWTQIFYDLIIVILVLGIALVTVGITYSVLGKKLLVISKNS